jgi:hypothetical protein
LAAGKIFSKTAGEHASHKERSMKDITRKTAGGMFLSFLIICAASDIQSADFKINDDTGTASQSLPAIAMHNHGPAVVCWMDRRSGDLDVYFQQFERRGQKLRGNVRANDDATRPDSPYQPAVAMDGYGHFVIGWVTKSAEDVYHAYARLFLADGNPFGGIVRVDDAPEDKNVRTVSLAMDDAGNTVAVWTDFRRDPCGDVFARFFPPPGEKAGPGVIAHSARDSLQWYPTVAMNGSGNGVVVWMDKRNGIVELYARRFGSGMAAKGPEFSVGSDNLSTDVFFLIPYDVVVQPDGSFAVCWIEGGWPIDQMRGCGRLYGATGKAVTPVLNVVDAGEFEGGIASLRVATDPSGGYTFAWTGTIAGDSEIYYRDCDEAGNFKGHSRTVNDLSGYQAYSDAASDRYSNKLMAWIDTREGNNDIYGTVLKSYHPMYASAGEGFNGMVPVMWEPFYGQAEPLPFQIYRRDRQSDPFSLVQTLEAGGSWVQGKKFSWVDTAVVNETRYQYQVKVASGGHVGKSEIFDAMPSAEGHAFRSFWARTAPVIDGRLSDGEWDDAVVFDISGPEAVHPIRLFMKNTGSTLYLAVDDSNDLFVEPNTSLGLVVDLDHNLEWDAAPPSDEGGLDLKQTGTTFHAMWGKYPGHLGADAPVATGGIHYLALAGSRHVQHEAAIDLSASPLKAAPGGTIGFGIWSQDPGNFYPAQYGNAGHWPAGMLLQAAKTMGSLTLATETNLSGKTRQAPGSFELGQNYPNPFNSSTTIPFRVKEPCRVTIKVFDVLGNEAAVLADGPYPAGNHTVRFNAAGLPSGLYLVRMEAGGFTASRKMALMK